MKAKGFTLIELLAVIVILAIIALIATPIVLGIIDDSKKSAQLRSAEFYLDGVEQAVMKENMNSGGNFRPTSCTITSEGNLECPEKAGILEIEVDGEKPKDGNITFEEGKITNIRLEYKNDKVIIKNEDGNLVYEEEPTLTYTSLGNYQHQSSDGTVEAHDTESGTCSKCGETVLAPGLYDAEGNMTVSWADLTSAEYQSFEISYGWDDENDDYFHKEVSILRVDENGMLTAAWCDDKAYNLSGPYIKENLVIPNNVISIAEHGLSDCTTLKSITIPVSVTSIKLSAMQYCENLTEINYEGTKEQWNNIELVYGWNEYCPQITVHCTDGDIVIPAN